MPQFGFNQIKIQNDFNKTSNLKLQSKVTYSYKSKQIIKGTKSLNLVSNVLSFKPNQFLSQNTNIEFFFNKKINLFNFQINEKLILTNYILPNLRYKNL